MSYRASQRCNPLRYSNKLLAAETSVQQISANAAAAVQLPEPTTDLDQARHDIREHGVCMVANALTGDQLRRAHDALYRAAADDRARGWETKFGLDYAHDETNQRVWNVLSRDPIFIDLVEHPSALELVRAVIGWPALLGNISANITGPGGGEMVMHADQIFVPEPWPAEPQGVNVAWALDDFTADNGATCIAPGSHRLNRNPRENEQVPMCPLVAPAGTMIVFESRVWHRTGFNRTADQRRAGVFGWYTRPIYRTQENWFLSLDPTVKQFASETMLVLLGYKTVGLGLVNGRSPA
jgi:ectoine hydroxylase-related dioxygenase (phytanoyl-CoA dioxygenase family)